MITGETMQSAQASQCPQCGFPTEVDRPFCWRCKFDLRHGTPGRHDFGSCIYCGYVGKFTNEHIYPSWLSKQYPRRYAQTVHTLNRPERHAFWEEVPIHGNDEVGSHDPYDTVVRNVCAPCNNGWMSRLQIAAKPLIESLANGEWPDFTAEESATLARWSTMVSINFECRGRILKAMETQRKALMNGDMPAGWRIAIGRMTDDTSAGSSFYRTVNTTLGFGNDGFVPIQSTYWVIERAAFHTLSSLGDRTLDGALLHAGLSGARFSTRNIWPDCEPATASNDILLTIDNLNTIQMCLGHGH